MATKVIVNGLDTKSKPKPIDISFPFVIEDKSNLHTKHIACINQAAPGFYQLVIMDLSKSSYFVNSETELNDNLYNIVHNGQLRDYIENTLGYRVIDCDLEIIINCS